MSLKNKTIIITGASRGIGRAMALHFAGDGANIVIVGKSVSEGKLPGTIYSVAKEVEALGGKALPYELDVRFTDKIEQMVQEVYDQFGSLHALVNNAGAVWPKPLMETPPKKLDLMFNVNVRATMLTSYFCVPFFKKTGEGRILNLSPPISLKPHWLDGKTPYTISKYGMSLAVLGLAEELKEDRIAVNALWPKTLVATEAVKWMLGEESLKHCRKTEIVAEAAYEILNRDFSVTGNLFLDEDVLREKGVADFSGYAVDSSVEPLPDFYVE